MRLDWRGPGSRSLHPRDYDTPTGLTPDRTLRHRRRPSLRKRAARGVLLMLMLPLVAASGASARATGFTTRLPIAAQGLDAEGDTMPDLWEVFFGLDPLSATDAAADP